MSVLPLDWFGAQVVACGDFGLDRPYATVIPWGVQALYFNAETDPLVTPELMVETAGAGFTPAVYFVMPRDSRSRRDGDAWARHASSRVEDLGGAHRVAAVLIDREKVPLEFQRGFDPRWDNLRPFRPTINSVEPFQDATINDYRALLARNANAAGVRKVTFQTYRGGMQPLAPAPVMSYLTERGLSPDDLCPTIDPAQPPNVIASAFACGTRGAIMFQAGRIPR